jgi:heme/copper-type cytochrome/quinol oxidase subunit 4
MYSAVCELVRKDIFGFVLGILATLLGFYTAYDAYVNLSLRGALFYLFVGIAWICLGVIAIGLGAYYWLEGKRKEG